MSKTPINQTAFSDSDSNENYTTINASPNWRQYKNYSPSYGWECPRCGCINAPWASQCTCHRNSWTVTCGSGITSSSSTGTNTININSDATTLPNSITFNTNSIPYTYTKEGSK